MKHLKNIVTILCIAVGFFNTAGAAETSIGYFNTIKNDPEIEKGKTYYLRHNLMYDGFIWDATNYLRGILLPINTKVTVVRFDHKGWWSGYDSGMYVYNPPYIRIKWDREMLQIEPGGFARRSLEVIAKNMLSPKPVPIELFGEEMARKIISGTLAKGMTREQVIMTCGWPPGHRTPSLASDRWIYWTGRVANETLIFSGDKLMERKGRKALPLAE